jgi:hypothetical protein
VIDPKKREGSGVFGRMMDSDSDRKGFRSGGERGLKMYVRRSESGGMSLRQVMVAVSLFVAIVFPFTGVLGWAGNHRDMGQMELSKPPLPVSRVGGASVWGSAPSCSPVSNLATCEAGMVQESSSR